MNLARLNHVFIPATKHGRDRVRRSPLRFAIVPATWAFRVFSEEGRYLIVCAVVTAILGLNVERATNAVLLASMLAALGVTLAARLAARSRPVSIDLHAPRQFERGRPTRVSIELRHDEGWPAVRIERPLKPWDGRWVGPRPGVVAVDPGRPTILEFEAAFDERGPHHLDPFVSAPLHPFRLTQGPVKESRGLRFMVVPQCARVGSITIGGHRIAGRGEERSVEASSSLDFVGVRPYRAGDRLRDLHALRSARVGQPVVREYGRPSLERVGCVGLFGRESATGEAAISLVAGVVSRIHDDPSRVVELLVPGASGAIEIGHGASPFSKALDELAVASLGRSPTADDLRRIREAADRWQSAILITSGSPSVLAAVKHAIQSASARVLHVHVVRRAGRGLGDREITVRAIERGEELAL